MATTGSLKQLRGTSSLAQRKQPGNTTGSRGGSQSGLEAHSIQRFQEMAVLLMPPTSLDDMDLKQNMATDIMLRFTYNECEVSVSRAEEVMKLPYRVMDEMLAWL